MTIGACSSSPPKQSELAHLLHARYGLASTQAQCVAKEIFRRFDEADLRRLRSAHSDSDLPSSLQQRFSKALDQLVPACNPAP